MITTDQARTLALSLPEATERDHHGFPSFRVRGKIFATLPDENHLRIMLAEEDILAAVHEHPTACKEFWWGARLACVLVDLAHAHATMVNELLTDAWRRKAPRRLLHEHEHDLG